MLDARSILGEKGFKKIEMEKIIAKQSFSSQDLQIENIKNKTKNIIADEDESQENK